VIVAGHDHDRLKETVFSARKTIIGVYLPAVCGFICVYFRCLARKAKTLSIFCLPALK